MSRSARILVVDDSAVVRRQVTTLLTRAGFEVSEAENGRAALTHIEADPSIALILCDFQMPELDGLAVLDHIKNHTQSADLRFVLLTSEMGPDVLRRAKAAGVEAWLLKPVHNDILLQVVSRTLGRSTP